MAYTARLTHGARTLNLNSSPYTLGLNFSPPATPETLTTAGGTSANRRGGAELVGKRAGNRAWTLPVRVMGASSAEVERAMVNLDQFLQQAGDESSPVYFEYLPNADVGFEPVWGQTGAWLRTEIVGATGREKWTEYTAGSIRERAAFIYIPLEIKPYALGSRQRLASALGGVLEDVLGTANGLSRGLIVAEASGTGGNEITNPIFGYPTTWNNDWTASNAALVASQNTDANFILFGSSSVKLTNTGAAVYNYRQSINTADVNTHALSCYVKLPDGSAVSATQCRLFYNIALTTAYTAIGDGWYRLTASVTGINGATNTGLQVAARYTVYADGFQFEEEAYSTPLYYGDMLGCAWAGTAHDSASTRTAAQLLIPASDAFSNAEGSLRIVWRPDRAHDADTNVRKLVQDDNANVFAVWFDGSDDLWRISDGTNTPSSSADTFAAYTAIVLHAVWAPGRLELYKNGTVIISGATYTPQAAPTNVYLGRNGVPGGQYAEGTFLGATFFKRAMSAAEVLADYNNVGQVAANGERVDWIPWLWTKDGDNILDGCDDSTYDNWAVINGIAGSVAADTEWIISSLSVSNKAHYWLLTRDYPIGEFCVPNSNLYFDLSGVVDANASGGQYQNFTIATTIQQGGGHKTIAGDTKFFLRAKQASASTFDCDVGYRFASGGNSFMTGDYVTLTCATSYRFFYVGQINVTWPSYHPRRNRAIELDYDLQALGANIHLDYLLVWPGNVTHLVTTTGTPNKYWIQGQIANGVTTADAMYNSCGLVGNLAELIPERENQMLFVAGGPGEANTITDTATFTVYVTPRWSLT